MKLIEVKRLSVEYGGVPALSDVSVDVEKGDYLGIVGPNGSGKTTFIKALLGRIPFQGEIFFEGKSFTEFTRSRHLGYLPQKMAFLDQRFPATVLEIALSGVYCCKRFPKRILPKDKKAALEALDLLGIADLENKLIGRISGGQQQRVLLARALVHHPEVLILDEPTAALDPESREIFYKVIDEFNKKKGMTILMVTHDTGSIGRYASRLFYVDRTVIFLGTFGEFCKSPEMTEYFGEGQHIICHRH